MKTSTKLTFYNVNNPSDTITEFYLGGSYVTPYTGKQQLSITREVDGETRTYNLSKESEQYVAYTVKTENGQRYLVSTILPIYDLESLRQNLEARCSVVRGEALYNIRLGVPIGLPVQDTKLAVLNTIRNTYGVRSCTLVRNYIQNGVYVMDVKIQSNLGETLITVGA